MSERRTTTNDLDPLAEEDPRLLLFAAESALVDWLTPDEDTAWADL